MGCNSSAQTKKQSEHSGTKSVSNDGLYNMNAQRRPKGLGLGSRFEPNSKGGWRDSNEIRLDYGQSQGDYDYQTQDVPVISLYQALIENEIDTDPELDENYKLILD